MPNKTEELINLLLKEESLPFVLGDKVYVIENKNVDIPKECPVCDGYGRITYKGFDLPCPYCNPTIQRSSSNLESCGFNIFSIKEYAISAVRIGFTYPEVKEYRTKHMPIVNSKKATAASITIFNGDNTHEIERVNGAFHINPSQADFDDFQGSIWNNHFFTSDNKGKATKKVCALRNMEYQRLLAIDKKLGTSWADYYKEKYMIIEEAKE